jgi:hypothetical protein
LLASIPLLLLMASGHEAAAESSFRSSIPNGTLNDSNSRGHGCGHCHQLPDSKKLNAFGSRWKSIRWGPTLAREDSDGDDVPNGWELGDPDGVWKKGDLAPGSPNFVTSPGQAGSVPPVLSATPLEIDHSELPGENLEQSVTIEKIGGDCFGNPAGACTLSVEASTSTTG